jgi:hypothetical protein
VTSRLNIVRHSSFKASPWKNGGGVTHEALRMPRDGPYRWRVSVAQIDESGPFSDFAGFRRHMVLLRGSGLTLEFGDGRQQRLGKVGDLAEFDGAAATHCTLLHGPCTDLNLIVATDATAWARVEWLEGRLDVEASDLQTTVIFSIEPALKLHCGNGERARLEPWDLATLSGGRVSVHAEEATPATPRPVFFATIGS